MLKFTIKPHDVLFFGGGKPFNIGGEVSSIFPPFPHSFASSIYAKFYNETKIAIDKDKGIYKNVYGPFIQKNDKVYFSAPSDLMREKKTLEVEKVYVAKPINNFNLLNIKDTDYGDDLESILWVKKNKELEPFSGFISIKGLKDWYNEKDINKDELLTEKDIFIKEDRISIHLTNETKTVKEEDGLYRVEFIRVKKDISFVFWIEADFANDSLLRENNINNDNALIGIFNKEPRVLKIGGEARTASYEVETNDDDDFKKMFNFTNSTSSNKNKLLFLTPGIFWSNEQSHQDAEVKDIEIKYKELKDIIKISCGSIAGYVITGISSKNYSKYSNKTVRAIRPGSIICLKNSSYNFSSCLDFFNPDGTFIGSNLVLVK